MVTSSEPHPFPALKFCQWCEHTYIRHSAALMDDADGGNGKYECAGTQESRKRDKLLQFTLLLKNGLVHAMRSTGPHQPSSSW